jgi:hypothetical protein
MKDAVMRQNRRTLLAVAFAIPTLGYAAGGTAASRDYSLLTCGDFLAAGKDNMAVIIWWLRGYHAGKSGIVPFDSADAYAARLGRFCDSHRSDNLLETSEQILADLDRGI